MGVRLTVHTPTLTFISHVPRRWNVQWQDEHNGPGMGAFEIHEDDQILTDRPTLLDEGNVVRVYVDGELVKSWLVENVTRLKVQPGEHGARRLRVWGRGVLAILQNAVVYPEYALRRDSADERSFDYGSADGPWLVPSQWTAPLGILQKNPASIRKKLPVRWPDPAAQWIWKTNPNAAAASGWNWFRGGLYLPADGRVTIYAAGDDRMWLQLDGEPVMQRSWRQWREPGAYTTELAAGWHLIAAAVRNEQTVDSLHAGGFICSVARVDRNNKVLSWLKRTSTTSFKVKGYGSAPGWFAASILKKLVNEGKARLVDGFSAINFGFNDSVDSNGDPWTTRQDRSFTIGTDLLDVCAQLTEQDLDVDLDHDLVLQAWLPGGRGTDRTATVRLEPGKALLQAEARKASSRIRNRALVRHRVGWVEAVDAASHAAYGRRETGISLGGTQSDDQANAAAAAAFEHVSVPEITVPVTITSAAGPQPYADFGIYDLITAPGISGAFEPHRVITVNANASDSTDLVTYTLDLYPEV